MRCICQHRRLGQRRRHHNKYIETPWGVCHRNGRAKFQLPSKVLASKINIIETSYGCNYDIYSNVAIPQHHDIIYINCTRCVAQTIASSEQEELIIYIVVVDQQGFLAVPCPPTLILLTTQVNIAYITSIRHSPRVYILYIRNTAITGYLSNG